MKLDAALHGHQAAQHALAVEAYGVRTLISSDSREVLDQLKELLPPGWTPCAEDSTDRHLRATTADGGFFDISLDGEVITAAAELDVAVEILDTQLRFHTALNAPDNIFVHAGVVAHRGRAIAIPGASFSGKTSLVLELVKAGAAYYSDEYAVLDADGLVHPYAKPLSIRDDDYNQTDHPVSAFGGTAGTEPLPLGLVIVAQYRPGARWEPRTLSAGDAVLAMLANTVPAQERPEQAMPVIVRAVTGAKVLDGERGEAAEIAPLILAALHD